MTRLPRFLDSPVSRPRRAGPAVTRTTGFSVGAVVEISAGPETTGGSDFQRENRNRSGNLNGS
jgi:hypothetical protein